jgi:Flp pilus assembly protein TadD
MTSDNLKNAGKPSRFTHPAVLCLLLVAVTLAVYWPVTRCDFVDYDDPDYFTSNPRVLAGLTPGNVAWAFATGHTCNWHPLTWLSLMLDVDLSGPGPAGPHVINLLFHLANAGLLFLLFRRLTLATWRSALVAALFALHPLHVESVAWISERKDVLSMFFGLLALLFYARYAQGVTSGKSRVAEIEQTASATSSSPVTRHPSLNYALALIFFAFSLMSKPMLVTLPFLMLLLDWWPLGRISELGVRSSESKDAFRPSTLNLQLSTLFREKWPFFVLSAISSAVTFLVQQKGGAVVALVKIPMAGRIENAFVAYARYLGKTVWPAALGNPYPHPGYWAAGWVVFSAVLVIGLSIAAMWLGRKLPFVPVGWFWFVGTLIPTIGLVQVGGQSMADRYTYLPLVGLFVIIAWGGGELWSQRGWPKSLIALAAGLLLAAGAGQTRIQLASWQTTETLFLHALAVTKNNIVACNKLGSFYSRQGRTTEAMDYFARALQINPDDPDVLYDLGNALAQRGDWDNAIRSYRHALQATPDQADVLNNLGFALTAKKQFADAIVCFEAALKQKPDYAGAHNNLATVLFLQKKFAEAARHFREAVRLTPGNPQFLSNLGDALAKDGQTAAAAKSYQAALQLKPGDPQIQAKLQALGGPGSN